MKTTRDEITLWQQRINAWRESGLKQSVWCRQNGVNEGAIVLRTQKYG